MTGTSRARPVFLDQVGGRPSQYRLGAMAGRFCQKQRRSHYLCLYLHLYLYLYLHLYLYLLLHLHLHLYLYQPCHLCPCRRYFRQKAFKGGVYGPHEALEMMNSRSFIGRTEQETATFRIREDGSLTYIPLEQFKLDVANLFVRVSPGSKPIPAEKFWRERNTGAS